MMPYRTYETLIKSIPFSIRLKSALTRSFGDGATVGDVKSLSTDEFMKLPQIGRKSCNEWQHYLKYFDGENDDFNLALTQSRRPIKLSDIATHRSNLLSAVNIVQQESDWFRSHGIDPEIGDE